MKTTSLPKIPVSGTVARVAIQCVCPDTGEQGSFLFTGPSHRTRFTRVSPLFDDLYELFKSVGPLGWHEVKPGNCAEGYAMKAPAPASPVSLVLLKRIQDYVTLHHFEAWIDHEEQAVGFDIPYRNPNGTWGADKQLVRTFDEARTALGY